MAIVWDREVYCSPTDAEFNFGPGRTRVRYARHWQVLSNDINDGPVTVCNAPSLPRPYSLYYFGNESDILALLTKIRPERNDKQPLLWNIHLGYEQIPGLQDPESPGEVNLTHYTPHVRIFPVFYEEKVMQARKATEATSWAWDPQAALADVKNSAGDFFSPFLTRTVAYTGVEIRQNCWTYNIAAAQSYMNTVNTDTFWGMAAGKVRMMTIGGVLKAVRDQLYWERTCEFHIKEHWGVDRMDYGERVFCDDDGKTGIGITPTGLRRPVDKIGQEIVGPVFLEGNGHMLRHGYDPVRYRWFPDDGVAFAPLNIPDPDELAIDIV